MPPVYNNDTYRFCKASRIGRNRSVQRASESPAHDTFEIRGRDPMNLPEAQALLAHFVSPYRSWRRRELIELVGHEPIKIATGKSGTEYRLEMHVSVGSSRDPTLTVSGSACEVNSDRWFKPHATVGFSVSEDGTVAFESGFGLLA